MYLVKKTYPHELGLSACFRQWRAPSHCRFLHGYPLSFTITLSAERLDENNWVFDFGGFKPVKKALIETFDHKLVVAEDDPQIDELTGLGGLDLADPLVMPVVGCEGFAVHVFGIMQDQLERNHIDAMRDRGLRIVSVECREHGGNAAVFAPGVV